MIPAEFQRLRLFPLRHHSPRSSQVLRAHLDATRPKIVLIEAPEDAEGLISILTDRETEPPVAILGYRTDGTPRSMLWPFAAYSPELVAMKWAAGHGVPVKFIDVACGVALASGGEEEEREQNHDQDHDHDQDHVDDNERGRGSVYEAMAEARGFRSFEEFWEASFEAPAYEEPAFRMALHAFADLTREVGRRTADAGRDAFMARKIGEVLAGGMAPEDVAVVCGAAHTAALFARDVDPAAAATLPAPLRAAVTVIPYSYPRLARQTGYGAGNRAPMYYQRAHDAGCDFRRASLEVLVEFTEHLRLRGFTASLADTIEAYRLACALGQLRGKAEPGLDEVREATIATMGRGDAGPVDGFLWASVIGRNVGKVASRVGRNSLQEEFWTEVAARRLPRTDSAERFDLKLNNEVEIQTSIFLHRLRVAHVPYAGFLGQKSQAAGGKPTNEGVGGVDALMRAREHWEAQWTPATDVALVESIVHGNSLRQVCERLLSERLRTAETTGAAADVLLEAVVTSCPEAQSEALAACDMRAAADDDLASLARAAHALSHLAGSGKSLRMQHAQGAALIGELLVKTYDRATLRVHDACRGDADAVGPAKAALRILHEIAAGQPLVDKQSWLSAARDLVGSYAVNAECAGMASGLLYLAGEIDGDAVSGIVSQRLTDTSAPEAAAAFLAGLLEVNSLILVKNRPLVQALDAFLQGIPADRFKDALPTLRRALGALGATERRYLVENVFALRPLAGHEREAARIITETDREKIKDAVKDLGDLDDLDDLL